MLPCTMQWFKYIDGKGEKVFEEIKGFSKLLTNSMSLIWNLLLGIFFSLKCFVFVLAYDFFSVTLFSSFICSFLFLLFFIFIFLFITLMNLDRVGRAESEMSSVFNLFFFIQIPFVCLFVCLFLSFFLFSVDW